MFGLRARAQADRVKALGAELARARADLAAVERWPPSIEAHLAIRLLNAEINKLTRELRGLIGG